MTATKLSTLSNDSKAVTFETSKTRAVVRTLNHLGPTTTVENLSLNWARQRYQDLKDQGLTPTNVHLVK